MNELIGSYEVEVVEAGCAPGSGRYGVRIATPNDISAVFPYLNAVKADSWYDPENCILIWKEPSQAYAFRPHEIRIARVDDAAEVPRIAREIVGRVNAIWEDRANIKPLHVARKRPSTIEIFRLLPGTNCRQCGYTTCLAYAAALSSRGIEAGKCPPLDDVKYAGNRQKIAALCVSI